MMDFGIFELFFIIKIFSFSFLRRRIRKDGRARGGGVDPHILLPASRPRTTTADEIAGKEGGFSL